MKASYSQIIQGLVPTTTSFFLPRNSLSALGIVQNTSQCVHFGEFITTAYGIPNTMFGIAALRSLGYIPHATIGAAQDSGLYGFSCV